MRAVRTQILIGFFCVALIVYFVLLGRIAVALIADGRIAPMGLGIALLLLPVVGAWALFATLRAGFTHQRLARQAAEAGMDLDVSDLPRRASGRIERTAADALFNTVRAELDADPDNWVRWYRVARAYDYAGDRSRAREAMRTAVEMEKEQR
jgi:cytochrome c-type biogenesis protein CcmH/NrfG